MDQNLQAPSFTPPGKPNYPLAEMEKNLKAEANYYTQEGRDTTSHAPNIGVGPWPIPWRQVFFNSTPQHGNLDNPNHNAYAHNWRNKDAAQEPYTVDWTQVPDRYKNTWPNGAYPQYMAETPYYPNYVAGQPRYPNVRYDEGTSGTLGGKLNANEHYTHEHIYLDRDDFTAIRQHKSVRPLKNPVPNGWKWTLEQTWTHEVSVPDGTDAQGNQLYK